jgi:hypothetical protein
MEKEKSLSEIIEEVKKEQAIRKEDEQVQALNTRIDDLERRHVKQQVDEQVRDSLAMGEDCFSDK